MSVFHDVPLRGATGFGLGELGALGAGKRKRKRGLFGGILPGDVFMRAVARALTLPKKKKRGGDEDDEEAAAAGADAEAATLARARAATLPAGPTQAGRVLPWLALAGVVGTGAVFAMRRRRR